MLLSAGATVTAIVINSGSGNLTSMERVGVLDRLAISLYSLAFYPWKTLVPVGLSPMYELPHPLEPWRWPFVVATLAVAGLTAASIALARRWPALAAAWAAYVVMTLPVAGVIQNGFQIAADRYTYLPCVPWALLAGGGLLALARGRRSLLVPAVALSALLLAGLATLSWRQTQIWRDTETLWRVYAQHLKKPEAVEAMDELIALVQSKSGLCLLCFERDPKQCHRLWISEILQERTGAKVEHIAADLMAGKV